MGGLHTWLTPSGVAERAGAPTKRAALAAVADLAARSLGAPASVILDRLAEREAQGSTGVGGGVALPHAQLPGLQSMGAVFLRLDQPAEFEAVDGRPVDLLFALFAPEGDAAGHLRALARVSRLLRAPALREQLRGARSPDALYALLGQEAAPSAA